MANKFGFAEKTFFLLDSAFQGGCQASDDAGIKEAFQPALGAELVGDCACFRRCNAF